MQASHAAQPPWAAALGMLLVGGTLNRGAVRCSLLPPLPQGCCWYRPGISQALWLSASRLCYGRGVGICRCAATSAAGPLPGLHTAALGACVDRDDGARSRCIAGGCAQEQLLEALVQLGDWVAAEEAAASLLAADPGHKRAALVRAALERSLHCTPGEPNVLPLLQ
jgi:hypothetical protein